MCGERAEKERREIAGLVEPGRREKKAERRRARGYVGGELNDAKISDLRTRKSDLAGRKVGDTAGLFPRIDEKEKEKAESVR